MEKGVTKKSNPALWSRIVSSVKAGTKGGDAGSIVKQPKSIASKVKKYRN
jgi:hypothetical protein